jgi:hypothetical protein
MFPLRFVLNLYALFKRTPEFRGLTDGNKFLLSVIYVLRRSSDV